MLVTLIQIIIPAAWLINIACLILFLYNSWKQESNKKTALAVLLLISAGMFYMESGITLRDGCDEQIVMNILSHSFFEKNIVRESAILFIYDILFYLTGKSLNVILICNKVLPFISIVLFFTILRRLGISITCSASAAALMFLNFNMMIAASSMYPSSCIIFLTLCSIASASFAFINSNSGKLNLKLYLLWFFSVLALIISFRAEIAPIPALLFILSFYFLFRKNKLSLADFKFPDYAILLIGIAACAICSAAALSFLSSDLINPGFEPYRNIIYHLIAYNFSVLFDGRLYIAAEKNIYMSLSMQIMFLALSVFILIGLGNLIKQRNQINTGKTVIYLMFFLLLLYAVNIYATRDCYPLQFVRQNIVCFTVFAFVFAFSSEGYKNIFNRQKNYFASFVTLFIFFYFCINAQTAFSLNNELRTNDKTWQIILNAQKELKGKYNIYSLFDRNNKTFINHFFHSDDKKYLKKIAFISPEIYAENIINPSLLTHPIFAMSDIYKTSVYKPIPEIPVVFGFFILKKNYELENNFINFNEKNINLFINELEQEIKKGKNSKLRISFMLMALAASGQKNKAKQTLKSYEKFFSSYGTKSISPTNSRTYCMEEKQCNIIHNLSYAIDNISNDKHKFIYQMIQQREIGRPEYLLDYIISVYQFPLYPYENNSSEKNAA